MGQKQGTVFCIWQSRRPRIRLKTLQLAEEIEITTPHLLYVNVFDVEYQ